MDLLHGPSDAAPCGGGMSSREHLHHQLLPLCFALLVIFR